MVYPSIRSLIATVEDRFRTHTNSPIVEENNLNKKRMVSPEDGGFSWLKDAVGEKFSGMP